MYCIKLFVAITDWFVEFWVIFINFDKSKVFLINNINLQLIL